MCPRNTQKPQRASPMLPFNIVLENALASYLRAFGTRLGNIQILDMNNSHAILAIAAQRGFDVPFLEAFAKVSADDSSACGRALRLGKSIIVPDVDEDDDFAPYRAIAHEAGYRSVISTPIRTSWGHVVGIISTHFPKPHRPSASSTAQGEIIALELAHDILETMDIRGDAATTAVRIGFSNTPHIN
jgi:GAF domain-containing protein